MKRNTIAEMHLIIDAIAEGKKIQFQNLDTNHPGEWKDIPVDRDFCPNFADAVHRIKPEEPEKRWRPFKDVQEFINTAGGLGAIWLKRKTGRYAMQVTGIEYADNSAEPICVDYTWLSLDNVFEGYTFADGRPCGVEEE